ncbi:MAG: L,D-transpeptidase family protein [Clostridia bacterium]|nr:L,D-transpeptidase family protein [Clostridia bacterium]
MKKTIFFVLVLLMLAAAAMAMAAPELSGVYASDTQVRTGEPGFSIAFSASEAGVLALQMIGENGEALDVGAKRIEAGEGRVDWNGLLPDGSQPEPGDYTIVVRMKNDAGEESGMCMIGVELQEGQASGQAPLAEGMLDLSALVIEEAAVWEEGQELLAEETLEEAARDESDNSIEYLLDENGVPVATSFWDMQPDAYDLDNPAHQQAIWDLMMQPITVIDGDQTENIYITNKPGISARPYAENCAGELHGQSQGVRIVEDDTDGDGYVLIEAYTNDGTKSESSYMESIAAQKVQGYIKKSRLYTEKPSDKYALLVDKLRQRMYVFEDGKIIGELLVSTGLNNPKQPYNETPAGEFLVVSWTGDFKAGSRTIGRYALRINGGTLIHEVLHDVAADGKTKLYDAYEPELGKKASHGCVRVQRRKNEQGMNMLWLWDNLKDHTKVFIWDDKGRKMPDPEIPDASTPLYRNPNGGSNYHLDQNCPGVKDKFLPLTGDLTYGDLESDAFKKLTPCVYCAAPARKKTLYERYVAAAEQIGAEIPKSALDAFGMTK